MIKNVVLVSATALLLMSAKMNGRGAAAAAITDGAEHLSEFTPLSSWLDTGGNFIQAHGGGFLYVPKTKTYYWYGEDRGTPSTRYAVGVSCYSSKDLYNWKWEGIVLPASASRGSDSNPTPVLERPKVIYNAKTGKYVMWMHIDSPNYAFAEAGVAMSDAPTGPFKYLGSERPNHEMSRDMTLFKDDNGKAYLIYASENNATMYVSLLTDDYLHQSGTYARVFINGYREAPAMFEYDGKYYLITSRCTGWAPNAAEYVVASSPLGPYTLGGNPCAGPDSSITFGGQSTYVLPVAGKPGAFIFMADKWKPRDLSNSRYIWLPLRVKGDKVTVKWHNRWDLSIFREN